ncbi:protein fuzzy homolog isoform X1 [Ctenocephalides felis]|uniref:protein fuzzy homolog isoform X1 n=1 Tax=Ctenocephalides felis TaxID=7515 RepID=UPI000E6E34D6|nr:protein fuzzy homolog isoform X1 [Ctenocephalides felis]
MAVYLTCITSAGGIPIFNRKKGDGEQLPFSTVGALKGIHLFCKTYSYDLQSTKIKNGSIVWKEFYDSIILIIISPTTTEIVLQEFLSKVFCAMVFYVGLDQLKDIKSVERLKRDLRPCMSLVEKMLENLNTEINYTECILGPDTNVLASCLESFSEQIESPFCCLLINNRLSIATEAWWTLHFFERQLLSLVALLDPASTNSVKELPVFLLHKSPNVAFRLIWTPVSSSSIILALCGPTPDASEITNIIQMSWQKAHEALAAALLCAPRNFPLHIQIDPTVLGILLINFKIGKYVISRSPQLTGLKRSVSGAHRVDVLHAFHNQIIKTTMAANRFNDDNTSNSLGSTSSRGNKSPHNQICDLFWNGFESYWCSEYHKCHCLVEGDNMMCIMYTSVMPVCTMRIVTQKTLKLFLTDKHIHW